MANGELTAHIGSLCSSLRSVLTSHGMAAWIVQRFGGDEQRTAFLPRLTGGELAGVAFSEPGAGSDLAAMRTTVRRRTTGSSWTGRRSGSPRPSTPTCWWSSASPAPARRPSMVPTATPGVRLEPVPNPLGCRAAGHANVWLGPGATAGRPSGRHRPAVAAAGHLGPDVRPAVGGVGLRRDPARLPSGGDPARQGKGAVRRPLADHQLVGRHLADLYATEQTADRVCEHASRCWDDGSPDMVPASVVAKYVSAAGAARGAAAAVQVLGSTGADDGEVAARAYRDAKVMEIIEGSTEICQLLLADHALAVPW